MFEKLSANLVKNMPHFTISSERAVVKGTRFIAGIIPSLSGGKKICLSISFIHNFQRSYSKSPIASCYLPVNNPCVKFHMPIQRHEVKGSHAFGGPDGESCHLADGTVIDVEVSSA